MQAANYDIYELCYARKTVNAAGIAATNNTARKTSTKLALSFLSSNIIIKKIIPHMTLKNKFKP